MKRLRTLLCLLCCALHFSSAPAASADLPRMYPTYAFQGTWTEIGKQTALHFRDNIITTGFVFENFIGIGATEALAYYDEIKAFIPPEIIAQMEGIALGLNEYASIPYDTAWQWVLIVNLGFDLLNLHKLEAADTAGCTAFALHSVDGTFLAHNTDNSESNLEMGSLIHYLPDNGDNAFLSFFAPAFVGASLAINEKGLAVTYNVGGRNKNPMAGLPMLLKTRQVMAECDNLTQAVNSFTGFLDQGGHYGYATCNFLLVDFKDDSMARLQVCSDEIRVSYGQELKAGVTFLAFTNEFDDDFSPRTSEDLENESVISSRARYQRLAELLPAFNNYGLETCWHILSDTGDNASTNNTICRRGEKTVTTIANIFTESTGYYTVGPPCEYLSLYEGPVTVDHDQPLTPAITGTVKVWGLLPLAYGTVTLKSLSGTGTDLKTCTDGSGAFAFNNLDNGLYFLLAGKFFHLPGFAFATVDGTEVAAVDIPLFF